jgi:hypothetical protein
MAITAKEAGPVVDALRSAYRVQTPLHRTESLFAADSVACHDYWLEQMRSNTHNSIKMSGQTYDAARVIMDKCKRVKDSGAKLAPACNVKLSKAGV